ncbi:DUF6124 family protein [Pseudomonas sp. Irchel 3E20]|uniref:DUF6124 family protein n=1 Tax=Pseudomonas sp. Irchel 3E20 TaxID=2008983 RepID=UPI000BA32F18|nr:DUF6124 family protein [Pseudomonas sp. Irchel 3E20]
MFKPTPNPPEDLSVSPYASADSPRFHEAAERALDFHLRPDTPRPCPPETLFSVVPDTHAETLLANAYQTLTSANAMACDLAFDLDGSRRHVALAIQQMIELGQLLVNRVLDVEHGHG